MGDVFIDWSKAPEGTTHALYHEGNAGQWVDGVPKHQTWWERHIEDTHFEWHGNWIFMPIPDDLNWIEHRVCCPVSFSKTFYGTKIPLVADDRNVPGYEKLRDVLERAYNQASKGKGAERHGKDLPFHLQPMQQIADMYGIGFMLGQVAKKIEEAQRLPKDRAINEILGAINYCAGAVIFLEKQDQ